jgi:hypothetical protein
MGNTGSQLFPTGDRLTATPINTLTADSEKLRARGIVYATPNF